MKNILILTDFSIRARYAAAFAMHIAARNDANIYLAHAIESENHIADTSGLYGNVSKDSLIENEAMLGLKELVKDLKNINVGHVSYTPRFQFILGKGSVAQIAKQAVKENDIDLVVTGSHKSNTISRFLMGSHTHQILDTVNCPVLLVPECMHFNGLNTIAYATDLTFNNSKVMNFLSRLAKPFHAKVAISHISLTGLSLEENLNSDHYFLKDFIGKNYPPVTFHTIIKDNIKAGLQEIAKNQKPDMLTLVHKRYSFLDSLFHTSASKQMADHAKLPLLVLPFSFSKNVADFTNDELDHFCFDANNSR